MPVVKPRPQPVQDALQFIREMSRAMDASPAEASGVAGDAFAVKARDLFVFQFENNLPYRRFCERRGVGPGDVSHWKQIPPVPTAGFKAAELVSGPWEHAFLTSGTTRGERKRGRHLFPELDLYEASWPEPFRRHLLPERPSIRMVSLIPSPLVLPDSSLSFMVGEAVTRFGRAGSNYYVDRHGFHIEPLHRALQDAVKTGEPVLILGTGLGFLDWKERLDASGERYALPPGSRIMDTGGFKGRSGQISRNDLLVFYEERLGIPPDHVVGEYGMTELCSQFYEPGIARAGEKAKVRSYTGPPWTRTCVLDPNTLAPASRGIIGLLAHWDLANAWSVMAVVTEDMGIEEEDGFRLLGRAEGAELRGCSLATEELIRD